MTSPVLPDRFHLLGEFTSADGSVLHRAKDKVLGREVVLKLPHRPEGAPAPTPAERERSLREARALARVQHPHVVRLFDVIETPDGPLLVLEPVAGETLAERLGARRKLDAAETVRIGAQITQALEAVHALGIVHRGVSAANIVLKPDGNALLSGFTFAKSCPGIGSAIPGTSFLYLRDQGDTPKLVVEPPHPAPEQIRGEAADARSDVFGLGWVLYECLAGEPPYPIELDVKHWRAPRTIPGIPKRLDKAVACCLAVDPAQRFASVAAARGALEGPGAGARESGWTAKHKMLAGAGTLAVAAGAFALYALGSGDSLAGDGDGVDRGSPVRTTGPGKSVYQPRYTASRALLIGIGQEYAKEGWLPLPNAEDDVKAIAGKLKAIQSANWEVAELLGPKATKEGIEAGLRKLSHAAGPDDQLFVFYAGHGEQGNGDKSGFVVPAGAKMPKDDPHRMGWLRFDEFARVFDETKAKHVLVAMDCCYGGKLAEAEETMRSAAPVYEEKFLRERAHVVITSGAGNQRVSDGVAGGNSPFAQAFLDQLARDDAAITSAGLFSEVLKRLAPLPGQSPRMSRPTGGALGEVVFFLK